MTKNFTTLAVFVAAMGILTPAAALAKTVTGRVTAFTPTSISVVDREIVTVGINKDTVFTKLITEKPWQADTATTANAVRVGNLVVVHVPDTNGFVANWVQVAVDFRVANNPPVAGVMTPAGYAVEALRHRAEAAAFRAAPNASDAKRPGSPGTAVHCDRIAANLEKAAGFSNASLAANPGTAAAVLQASSGEILTGKEVRDLIANAKTPAEHRKLARHFAAVAARYEADAADHVAEAKAYRTAPGASESKRPGSPDTAAHCDRLADAARNAATAARELARDHEQMAK
jgi:hypothetical protein